MNRTEQRQLLRALGWRGSKAKRQRRYPRPDLLPRPDAQTAAMLAARQATTTTQAE